MTNATTVATKYISEHAQGSVSPTIIRQALNALKAQHRKAKKSNPSILASLLKEAKGVVTKKRTTKRRAVRN